MDNTAIADQIPCSKDESKQDPSRFVIPADRDVPLEDPALEARAQFLIHQLIRPGQRLCVLEDDAGGKKANPLARSDSPTPFMDGFNPADPYWRNMIRRHVVGQPARVTLRYVDDDDPQNGRKVDRHHDGVALGAYYGGLSGIGNNEVASFALDCDKSIEHAQVLNGLKIKEERHAKQDAWKADPTETETEKSRLLAMMATAKALFPTMRFLAKADGKWHGHANLSERMDAERCKRAVTAMLPEAWLDGNGKPCVEVFPKTAEGGKLEQYGVGNQVRLPFNPDCRYEPLDGDLSPILPMTLQPPPPKEEVRPVGQPAIAGVAKSADASAKVGSGRNGNDALEARMLADPFVLDRQSYPLAERVQRYELYILSDRFDDSVSGCEGHNKLFKATCMRFAFAVPRDAAWDVILKYDERKCIPRWKAEDLRHKLDDSKLRDGRDLGWLLPRKDAAAPDAKPASKAREPSQCQRLMALAGEAEFWRTAEGVCLATIPVNGHRENHRLRSKWVRAWLRMRFAQVHGGIPGSQAVEDALAAMEARARFEGREGAIGVRLAHEGDRGWLDLGDASWRIVGFGPDGWRLVDPASCPVRFLRPDGMLPLPEPVPGGSLSELRPLVNLGEERDWRIVASWLVGCLMPGGPFPILAVNGEQASAKTTLCRMLKNVLDPSKAPLRTEPTDPRNLMIGACNGWIFGLDNVSSIPPWLSDALCRLSTGGGYATRELYSDDGERIFDACRPILVNGIEELATRSDLLDRCLCVTLPTIPEGKRVEERILWPRFEGLRPRLLGALLDASCAALRGRDSVRLPSLPRMADHCRWACAAAPALGLSEKEVFDAIEAARESANASALDGNPVVLALERLLARDGSVEAVAGDMLRKLEDFLERDPSGKVRIPNGWPRSPKGLAGALRRLAPNLRKAGIGVEFSAGHRRTIRLSATASDEGSMKRDGGPCGEEDLEF